MNALEQLDANYDFLLAQKEHLLREHAGKFVLIYRQKFVNAFDTYKSAIEEGVRLFGAEGGFLVEHLLECEPVNFVMSAMR